MDSTEEQTAQEPVQEETAQEPVQEPVQEETAPEVRIRRSIYSDPYWMH